jgi:chaperonin GroES
VSAALHEFDVLPRHCVSLARHRESVWPGARCAQDVQFCTRDRALSVVQLKSTMHIIPLDDRIIVRREDAAAQGIAHVIADPARGRSERGLVIAVGAGELNGDREPVPLAVRAGDTVLFVRHIGRDITFGGAAYVIMKGKDVLGIEGVGPATNGRHCP